MTGPLLKPEAMAKALNVSEQTLANWRSKGVGPEYIKLGPGKTAAVRYKPIQRVAPIESDDATSKAIQEVAS